MTISTPVTPPRTDWMRHLADQMRDLVCVCRNGRIDYINEAGARLLGAGSGDALIGSAWPVAIAAVARPADGGFATELPSPNGTVHRVEGRTSALDAETVMIRAWSTEADTLEADTQACRRLVEMTHDGLCLCRNERICFANPAAARLMGAAVATELHERPLLDLLHPEDRPRLAGGLRSLAAAPVPVALRLMAADGRIAEVELRVMPFGSVDDDLMMIEVHDVTAINRAASALREREQRLRDIVDAVGEAIVTADENGIIQSFNPAATRIFGHAAEEVIGRNVAVLIADYRQDEHDRFVRAYLGKRRSAVLGHAREARGRRADGSVFPLEFNVAHMRHEGRPLLIGIIRDITGRKRAEEAQRRARDLLEERVEERTLELSRLSRQNEQILNSASEGIIGLDADGTITFANPTAAEATGWRVHEMIGRRARDLLFSTPGQRRPDKVETEAAEAVSLIPGTTRDAFQILLWRRDGTSFHAELASAPIEEQGRIVGSVVVFRDITERRQIEDKLRLAAAVFDTTAEAIVVLDPSFRVTTINPAFTAITGYAASEVIGRPPPFLSNPTADTHLRETIWGAVRQQGRWNHEQWSRRRNGEEYAERLSITGVADDQGRIAQYIVVFADITQRKLDEERIRYQANYDSLTGLPNRSLFMDRLNQVLSHSDRSHDRVGLMFLDLDGFKLVNDTLGHDIGDDLLKEASQRLLASVRQGDTVARLGGDEFTIIMPELGQAANAPVVAQRIIDALERPFSLNDHEAFVSASIGISCYPDDAQDATALLKNADAAMYRAKEQGKANFQFFTADLNAKASERLVIKNGLSKALERGEFLLHYQPKCELATGRMTGVEALLRWQSPELGLVPPVKFIPVMEESGLIGAVGEWALETACRQHRLWRDAGHPHMRVAVNLSVRQLRQPALTKTVERILAETGIEPGGLELEITESMIMKDTENAVTVLRHLHDMGIHLAMDDFGTGYSSLSYLKLFPLHTIKIDRSFVRDIATDPDDLEIIRTIITMGHSLRHKIVAEGVETEEQRVLLRKLRCDEMQGYLLSRPVPAEDIDRMLESMTFGTTV